MTRRARARIPEDDLHRRTERAAVRPGRQLHAGVHARHRAQQLGRDDVRPRGRHADALQRHLRRRSADAGRGVLHLHLHATGGATTRSTPVASCGPDVAGTAPDWITTTCTQPPGPTNFPATPSLPCTVGPPVTDVYLRDDDLHQAGRHRRVTPRSCVADAGLTPPYLKVTCLHAGGHRRRRRAERARALAGTVGAGHDHRARAPLPDRMRWRRRSRPASTARRPTLRTIFETTCTTPPATNQTDFTTPAACGAPGITVGVAAGLDHERLPQARRREQRHRLRRPALLHQRSGHRAPVPEGRPARRSRRCCPTPVPPATCPIGTTYGRRTRLHRHHLRASAAWAPPTPVAACTPIDPTIPPFVVTTCGTVGNRHAGGVLQRRRPSLLGRLRLGHLHQRNNTGPTQVATCIAARRPCAPNFVKVTCAGSTTTAPVAVAPATCAAPGQRTQQYVFPTQIITCDNQRGRARIRWRPRCRACTNGIDAGLITTICTFPTRPTTTRADPVRTLHGRAADLRRQPGQDDLHGVRRRPSSWRRRRARRALPQSGTGPEIICTTTTTLARAVGHLRRSASIPASPFDTTTACYPVGHVGRWPTTRGACVAGPDRDAGRVGSLQSALDRRPRRRRRLRRGTDVAGCQDRCAPTAFGSGHKYTVVTDDDGDDHAVQRRRATRPGRRRDDDHRARRTSTASAIRRRRASRAQPPVDIAGCSAWPCTQVTVLPGGSENSLADVAQYYYKTDLRAGPTTPTKVQRAARRQRGRGRQRAAPAHDDVQRSRSACRAR